MGGGIGRGGIGGGLYLIHMYLLLGMCCIKELEKGEKEEHFLGFITQ